MSRPQYFQIGTLKPEMQGRAIKVLRGKGALDPTPSPRAQPPGELWCGHRARVDENDPGDTIEVDGVEICGVCTADDEP